MAGLGLKAVYGPLLQFQSGKKIQHIGLLSVVVHLKVEIQDTALFVRSFSKPPGCSPSTKTTVKYMALQSVAIRYPSLPKPLTLKPKP